jgi:hypothetical protein
MTHTAATLSTELRALTIGWDRDELRIRTESWEFDAPYSCLNCHRVIASLDDEYEGHTCTWCDKCGQPRRISDAGSTPGFCAGSVYWANLECGHQIAEDCSYLEM